MGHVYFLNPWRLYQTKTLFDEGDDIEKLFNKRGLHSLAPLL